MASITIRNLDKQLKARFRVQAVRHGRSMEEEARQILRTALTTETKQVEHLAEVINKRFAALGGVELPDLSREPVDFEK